MIRTIPKRDDSRIGEVEDIMKKRPTGEYVPSQRREGLDNLAKTLFNADLTGIDRRNIGGVECSVYPQAQDDGKILIYLHGGAFCIGSDIAYAHLIKKLANLTKRSIFFVNYALAPESKHPAAVDDCFSVYAALLESGRNAENCVCVGDSAGAALALALCDRAIKNELPLPAKNVLISPWVDLSLSRPSITARAHRDKFLRADALEACVSFYLGDTAHKTSREALFFSDPINFPPVLIQVGTEEILYDDAESLYQTFCAAGVDATLENWEGMCHVWPFFFPILAEGENALAGIAQFVNQ